MLDLAVAAQTEWRLLAACQGHDTEDFFPVSARGYAARSSRPPDEVQRICDACPVRIDCLNYALQEGEHGIWGGTTDEQRDAIRRTIRRSRCPTCASGRLHPTGTNQVCGDCGTSWQAHTTRAKSRSRRPNLGIRHRRAAAPAAPCRDRCDTG